MNIGRLNFVTYFDINYIDVFLAHYFSILKYYKCNEFKYYIGVDKKTFQKYGDLLKSLGNVEILDVENIIINEFRNYRMLLRRITIFTMARIMTFDLFPELKKTKFIYIDVDTMFNGRISHNYLARDNNIAFQEFSKNDFYYNKLFGFWFNSGLDPQTKSRILSLIRNGKYFNAGVIIVNDSKSMEKLFKTVLTSRIFYDDQTLLNYFNNQHIDIIDDVSSNCIPAYKYYRESTIFHFAGWTKPKSFFKAHRRSTKEKIIYLKIGYLKYLLKALMFRKYKFYLIKK